MNFRTGNTNLSTNCPASRIGGSILGGIPDSVSLSAMQSAFISVLWMDVGATVTEGAPTCCPHLLMTELVTSHQSFMGQFMSQSSPIWIQQTLWFLGQDLDFAGMSSQIPSGVHGEYVRRAIS